MFFLPDRIFFLKVQSKYGSSNELLMHFLVRERGPSDCLRGQEKWPQNAKSLFLDPLGALSSPQTPRQYNIFPHLFAHFFLLLKLFLKTLSEWVSDCCLKPREQFIELYHGWNKLYFDEMMSTRLYQHA